MKKILNKKINKSCLVNNLFRDLIHQTKRTMINFTETQAKASKELTWLINSTSVSKEYNECVEKKYTGKLPYAMVMKVLKNNSWGKVEENGKSGYDHKWIAQSMNAGFTYQSKTGLVEFTYYEAK